MARPLEGIRVIEIGNLIAGPFCGMLLGDMGADVIKIEKPGRGDYSRAMPPMVNGESVNFAGLNRNKRSLALDLKHPEGQEIVRQLVAKADVFLENNRPGALDAIGFGPEQVRAQYPGIVYVSVSGFGRTGPYKRRAGVNLTIEAFSGALSVNGEPDQKPMRPGIQTVDMYGALFGAYAVLAGLVKVLRTKEGHAADISMAEASVAVAAWETAQYLTNGEVPQRMGDHHRLNAPYSLFATSDGEYVALSGARDHFFRSIMKVLDLEQCCEDPRFKTSPARKVNETALLDIMSAAIKQWKGKDFEAKLVEQGVPCSLVNNYAQVMDDPQIKSRGMVVDVEHPRMGKGKAVRNPVLLDRDPPQITRPAPSLGQHSAEILRELGYAQERIDALGAAGVVRLG
jgi:CoA:oxalate CoA-transferase